MFSASDDLNRTAPNHCSSVPGNPPYSESSVPGTMPNLSFLHSPVTDALISSTQTQQNHFKLPVTTAILSQGATGASSDMLTTGLGDHVYNYWKDERPEMLFMQTIGDSISGSNNLLGADDPQMILQAQLGITNGKNLSFLQPNVPMMQNHGLSLSLRTQMPVPSIQCLPACSDLSLSEETFQDKSMHGGAFSSNLTALILNSKYLNAAQELLNEVANVKKALKKKTDEIRGKTSNPKEIAVDSSGELSPSEKQDLNSKVTKLLEMLDEVDRRYKHYYHQMQTIVSYLDMIAGSGAAKPYTSLALQTISCHFRCLRDAISGQIQVARKSLGEPDNSSSMCSGLSRLRGIDQQLRQQRLMQQLGMMQPNAWRPQRGLPESSVSILRAWLFDHFLHPYPNDSEKIMLARQTGLSRSQIANWFINARVRLWKPMIEDMYKEEFGDIEIDSNSSLENPPKAKEDTQSSINVVESVTAFQNEPTTQVSSMNTKIGDQRPIGEDSSFLQDAIDNADQSGRFFAYQMTELGQYENNGVSLTLGLPISDNQQSFLALRRNDYSNVGDQQQGFLSTHLLHDFV